MRVECKEEYVKQFQKRIRLVMGIRGYSQTELANKIGTTREAVRTYVHGENVPNIFTLRKICDVIGCSSDYLLGISDDIHREVTRILERSEE